MATNSLLKRLDKLEASTQDEDAWHALVARKARYRDMRERNDFNSPEGQEYLQLIEKYARVFYNTRMSK